MWPMRIENGFVTILWTRKTRTSHVVCRSSLSMVGFQMYCKGTSFNSEPVKKLTDVQGHRTYPAFIHFLTCITLLSLYIGVVSGMALIYAFNNPFAVVGHVNNVSSGLHYWLHCSERGHTVPWSSSDVCRYCIQSRGWFLLELSSLPHLVGFHLIFPCVY